MCLSPRRCSHLLSEECASALASLNVPLSILLKHHPASVTPQPGENKCYLCRWKAPPHFRK